MGSAPEKDDDFRRAVADAQPLDARRKVVHQRRPAPVPAQRLRDERAVLDESLGPVSLDDALDSGTELTFLADGQRRDVLRKLRRGHWVVEDELDLHGMNRQVAALAVSQFLKGRKKRHVRCVRIVHGKGRGSHNREPVLKGLLRKWLLREEVLAFSQAPAAQGGSGAVLVLLKA
ncbi:MAG TPA: Smr/MutS family protein [Burkholderiales bacterium]|nr:Smr/MutS family protein [Burkholderiales bacterium]